MIRATDINGNDKDNEKETIDQAELESVRSNSKYRSKYNSKYQSI